MRIGEALDTKWTDIDLNRGTVNVTPEKHGHARQLKLSNNLTAMLNRLPRKWPLIFRNPKTPKENMIHTFRRHYINQRRRVADKLQNPRIEAITFHTMRHFYATMLYSKTRDLLLVKEKLGHRAIQNTLIYTHLVNFESDEYVSKVATTVGEAQQLIEAGFDYVCDVGENKLFKKRK
ncbi:MAG: site-specific integrase [Candidatus Bathyarchaeia archaeon]|jgi:integrase